MSHSHFKKHAKTHRNIVHHESLNFDSFLHLYVYMAHFIINGSIDNEEDKEEENEVQQTDIIKCLEMVWQETFREKLM